MTYLKELFGQVFGSLLRNKLRSFLTMAGIAWGIASIVIIVAMGDGFKEGQRNNMKGLGENIVILFGGRTEKQAGGQRAGQRIRLNYDDVAAIRQRMLAGARMWSVRLKAPTAEPARSTAARSIRMAWSPRFNQLRSVPLSAGRWFSDEDDRAGTARGGHRAEGEEAVVRHAHGRCWARRSPSTPCRSKSSA